MASGLTLIFDYPGERLEVRGFRNSVYGILSGLPRAISIALDDEGKVALEELECWIPTPARPPDDDTQDAPVSEGGC